MKQSMCCCVHNPSSYLIIHPLNNTTTPLIFIHSEFLDTCMKVEQYTLSQRAKNNTKSLIVVYMLRFVTPEHCTMSM